MANILLVEDDTTFSAILEGFLKRNGHESVIKYTVKSAVEALRRDRFDLILLDYRLSDGTGQDVLDAMRTNKIQVPVVIMTSFNDVRTAVRAMRQVVFEYITKPVNPDELLMIMNDALKQEPA